MGFQSSINQALGAAGTAANLMSISNELKESNVLKKQEVASGLQNDEAELVGKIAQDEQGIENSKQELKKSKQELKDLEAAGTITRDERGRYLKKEAREEAFNEKKKELGYNVKTGRQALKSLKGQLEGKKLQLANIQARMKEMNVESLLGGNE